MSRVYFIHDAQGERRLEEDELPISIGGPGNGAIALPGMASLGAVAHIALSEGHAFIQPAQTDLQLFHNHERLTASKWLKSGDLVELAGLAIRWDVRGDQVDISVGQRPVAPVLHPPSSPPPLNSRVLPDVSQHPYTARPKPFIRSLLLLVFACLLLGVGFILLATPVVVSIQPDPARLSLRGFPPAVPFGGRQLVLPGAYTLVAESDGYYPLREEVVVRSGGLQTFEFTLQELPGLVRIGLEPDVPFKLFVNDNRVVLSSKNTAKIAAGAQRVRIETARYLPVEEILIVQGKGQAQQIQPVLQPAWARVRISSEPTGATLRVDGEDLGNTPLEIELLQGQRELGLTLQDFKPLAMRQQIQAGTDVTLGPIKLVPVDGSVTIDSVPPGASLRVDGMFRGTTPLSLSLASGTEHQLVLSKPGYRRFEQQLILEPDEKRSIEARLQPQYGVVFVTAQPADASLQVDGREMGKATQRLRLTTRSHSLVFSKPGYVPKAVSVTPRAGISKNVDVRLARVAPSQSERQKVTAPSVKTSAAGQGLQLVRPQGSIRMGASRREAGRRANERSRQVKLVRPFYLASNEVSNAEYRLFRPSHDSGAAEGGSLNADKQPVVNLSWEDAARYCNWLSKKEGLPAAYREIGRKLEAVRPLNTGYRLPTEAEWAYVARKFKYTTEQRYPWTGGFPPTSVVANVADISIADTLANTVPNYNDGYRVSAPVGSFPARPAGFHDLGGNVAEWIHDYYAIYPGEMGKVVSDPSGPASGTHHVVRDSSWRQGSITELRLSYRDYSRSARPDLGFRIARYAE